MKEYLIGTGLMLVVIVCALLFMAVSYMAAYGVMVLFGMSEQWHTPIVFLVGLVSFVPWANLVLRMTKWAE